MRRMAASNLAIIQKPTQLCIHILNMVDKPVLEKVDCIKHDLLI